MTLTLQATQGQCTNMQSCITLCRLHATYDACRHRKPAVIHAAAGWTHLTYAQKPCVPKFLYSEQLCHFHKSCECATAVQMLDRSLQAYHALWVCDEVRTDVAPVKLHALHHIQVVLSSSGLLHGHHALTPHTSHGITDQLSNLHQRTSRSAVAAYHTTNNRNCVQHIKTQHNTQAGHAAVVDMSTQGKCLGAGP